MKEPTVPVKLKAHQAVARAVLIEGALPLAHLPRLAAALAQAEGSLQVSLQFGEHRAALGQVRGTLKGLLWLTCQRSLESFQWPLEATVDWALVGDEAHEEALLADADPVLLDDENLLLHQSIEDEVLLCLPLMPLAPEGSLATKKAKGKTKPLSISDNAGLDDTRPNPFAALKGQFPRR